MSKKIKYLLMGCCIMGASVVPLYANQVYPVTEIEYENIQENTITEDTSVTKDNVFEVLDYLGIDRSDYVQDNSVGDNSGEYTVGELRNLLKIATQEVTKINGSKLNNKTYTENIITPYALTGSMLLSSSSDAGTFTLVTSVNGKYYNDYWTGASGENVTLVSNTNVGITHAITEKRVVTSSYTASTISVRYDVTVETRITIPFGYIPSGSNDCSGTIGFPASKYLKPLIEV